MLILANALALALIVADEPRPPEAKPADAPTTLSALPKVTRPNANGDPEAEAIWHLTLPEAIRIGLDNSEVIRVISLGAVGIPTGNFHPISPKEEVEAERAKRPPGITIARLNRDGSAWKFQSDVMAHVRSIEQQYWALSHQSIELWARETAVRLGAEILARQKAELAAGRGAAADVAEAEQQVENFRLALVTATSDLITTERQLRNILGLPPTDGRRIVPATAPTEAQVEPDWEISVREMTESQPDIAQQRAFVRLNELELLLARNQLLPLMGPEALHEFANLGDRLEDFGADLRELIRRDAARPYPAGMDPSEPRDPEFIGHAVGLSSPIVYQWRSPLRNTRQAQYQLLRQRAALRQVTHQATHSLARFFLEIDANYKQFRTAQRLREAAQQRLEAQRAFHEQGRITIDRLLDAVGQYANAIAQESQYRCTYNTAIAALEEAKGTLLAFDKITVLDQPIPRKPDGPAGVDAVATASFEGPTAPAFAPPPARVQPAPMSYKVKARLLGLPFLDIEVEASPAPATPATPPVR